MFYAGIDPSITNTGIVLLAEDGSLTGAINSRKYDDDKTLDGVLRYARICVCLCNALKATTDRNFLAGYEDYSFGSTHRAFSLAEFGGILKKSLYDAGARGISLFAPAWNKKFATGNGTAGKEQMMEQAVAECPQLKEACPGKELTSDVCDAYFLAKAAWYLGTPAEAVVKNESNRARLRPRLEMVKEWKTKEK